MRSLYGYSAKNTWCHHFDRSSYVYSTSVELLLQFALSLLLTVVVLKTEGVCFVIWSLP